MTAGLLLDSGAFDPEEKNSCGKTPFAIASEGGAKWVSALLSGQDPFDEATMKTGGMDIFQALRQRDMEALGALLEAGVDLQQECTDSKMYDFEGRRRSCAPSDGGRPRLRPCCSGRAPTPTSGPRKGRRPLPS